MPPRTSRHHPASDRPTLRRALSLVGFMGSGKSVVGALVAYRANAPFLDLDFMIETEAGMTIPEIFSAKGETAFRALESRLLPDALRPGSVAALGGGTAMSEENWRVIGERSRSVYLELSFDAIWARIGHAEGRPLISGRLRSEVEALFERRRPRYEQATFTVGADRSPDAVAADVLALW